MAKKLISYDDQKPGLGLPDVVEGRLDGAFADKDLEERVAPQKTLFELPVEKMHRNPNLAILEVHPGPEIDIQVVRTEGDTLWGYARDRSLYKYTPTTGWVHVSYQMSGFQERGGLTRCQDGSLLMFTSSFTMRRSTDEGKTWTDVLPRRAAGLEPLTTQSIAVESSTGHIYYGEYTNGVGAEWADIVLWRSTDHGATWEIFHTWPRPITGLDGAISHIHGVQYDPIGKDIYVMLGDGTPATGLWKVQGDTCVPVLTNEMMDSEWHDSSRAIGLMFFPDYIAWGSDSTTNPYIFRIPRSALGVDPSKLERGPRMSSTSWGTARASEDGSRWALFSSDEAFPTYAADRMAHIYSVEDQGATVYEVGAISSQGTRGVTTIQPLAPAEDYGDHFWFGLRTGSEGRYGAWKARLGYGGQTIPWPTPPKVPLTQSQSSGLLDLPASTSLPFGVTRAPVFATKLAIFESSLIQYGTENHGNVTLEVLADGVSVYSSNNVSVRQRNRSEHGGPVTVIDIPAHQEVQFQLRNVHTGATISAAGTITFGWVR